MRTQHAPLALLLALATAAACAPDAGPDQDPTPDASTQPDSSTGPDAGGEPDVGDEPDADDPDADAGPPPRDPLAGAWSQGFGFAGAEGGPGAGARAVLEDADGSVVYAGSFDAVSGVHARNVARWDGASWAALGDGVPIDVNVMVRDADAGVLYVGGESFSDFGLPADPNAIWSWDGAAWTRLADVDGDFTRVHALHLSADGQLWVGGQFEGVGGSGKPNLARLDLSTGAWGAPDATPDGGVRAIEPVGDALCVGGSFWGVAGLTELGGVACIEADGAWAARGAGLPGEVYDLMPDGATGELLASGSFAFTTDPATGAYIAGLGRWDGATWSPWAGGVDGGRINVVRGLERMPDGSVLAWGAFTTVVDDDGVTVHLTNNLARHAEGAWQVYGEGVRDFTAVLAPGVEGAYDVAVTDDGRLYVGGLFLRAGDTISRGATAYTGGDWRALAGADHTSSGLAMGLATAFAGDPDGDTVYVGGSFRIAGDQAALGVAALDVPTRTWSALGLGLDGFVSALALEPGTERLWAAGEFTLGDGSNAALAVFDGARWAEADGADFDAAVYDLAWHDGTLYVAGSFSANGGAPMMHVAAWDGAAWAALGDGVGVADDGGARALAVAPDGSVVVGGGFEVLGSGGPAKGLAVWDGSAWSELGGGLTDDLYVEVYDLAYHGGDLIVGGAFTRAGDLTANSIARWDGAAWHGYGGGFAGFDLRDHVGAVLPYGDGVFATGTFRGDDGSLGHVAWWDGLAWHALGSGLSDLGEAAWVGAGGLWVSGPFTTAGGEGTYGLAHWSF